MQKKSVDEQLLIFNIEVPRVRSVLLKLARGHVAYELSTVCRSEPSRFLRGSLSQLSIEEREYFEDIYVTEMLPEIGSRGLQRLLVTQVKLQNNDSVNLFIVDWVEVQQNRYRYLAYGDKNEIRVKIVLSDYLYCVILWASNLLPHIIG